MQEYNSKRGWSRKKIIIKESAFTVDFPFIEMSKRFPKSRNAPSTKSAHSVTDISSMKTVHQRQRSPDSPTTSLNEAVSLVPWGSFFFFFAAAYMNQETPSIQQCFCPSVPRRFGLQRIWPIIIVPTAKPYIPFCCLLTQFFLKQSMNQAINPLSYLLDAGEFSFLMWGMPIGK